MRPLVVPPLLPLPVAPPLVPRRRRGPRRGFGRHITLEVLRQRPRLRLLVDGRPVAAGHRVPVTGKRLGPEERVLGQIQKRPAVREQPDARKLVAHGIELHEAKIVKVQAREDAPERPRVLQDVPQPEAVSRSVHEQPPVVPETVRAHELVVNRARARRQALLERGVQQLPRERFRVEICFGHFQMRLALGERGIVPLDVGRRPDDDG
mmetsp:Transcript_4135/g.12496  ORF Transcript_4135/g.12496 Transcript_4135/m.12496 type:complete len:208 (-) Transcript_4135:1574-2197(-)